MCGDTGRSREESNGSGVFPALGARHRSDGFQRVMGWIYILGKRKDKGWVTGLTSARGEDEISNCESPLG